MISAVLGAVALAAATPAWGADPASSGTRASSRGVLAQGLGMGARPSVRVRRLQRTLVGQGFDVGAPGVDGRFGPLTDAAVRRMQGAYGVTVDGLVGPSTRRALRKVADRPRRRAAHHTTPPTKSTPQPQPQSTSGRTPTQAPSPAAPARPAPQPVKANPPVVQSADNGTEWLNILAVIAAAALLLVGAARTFDAVSRRRRIPGSVPLAYGVGAVPDHVVANGEASRPTNDHPGVAGRAAAGAAPAGSEPTPEHGPQEPGSDEGHARKPIIGYVVLPATGAYDAASETADIEGACERMGYELLEVVHERAGGGARLLDRAGLAYALQKIRVGEAEGLMISELMELSRSIAELATFLKWFADSAAPLIALDLGIDTSTQEGQHSAEVIIKLGRWDRIARGTRDALAEITATRGSVRPRAVRDWAGVQGRIAEMRANGMSLQAIADELNTEGVPAPRGGVLWRPSRIQAALGESRSSPEAETREHRGGGRGS